MHTEFKVQMMLPVFGAQEAKELAEKVREAIRKLETTGLDNLEASIKKISLAALDGLKDTVLVAKPETFEQLIKDLCEMGYVCEENDVEKDLYKNVRYIYVSWN